ncbi:MAG: Epoxyqueuosine reductase [Planctomycetes bacterium ADurb.Bin401]|nr:MAG: Epoxyqueuosine reductase [Planctomycetes bacterium ADurb.Bin401]
MTYLSANLDKRFSPRLHLPDAKSVICVAINYKPAKPISQNPVQIALFALYPDYHIFIKEKLQLLADFLMSKDSNFKYKIRVDSLPFAERLFAIRAGLGFIGKNRLLTNAKYGSFLLLGEIITNMELQPDNHVEQQACGDCRKCIESCPTKAICDNGFDASKCISYLTMKKGDVDDELKSKMGTHLFGCDECLRACPYNDKSPACEKQQIGFVPRDIKIKPQEIIGWTEKDFETFTANSTMHWIGLEKMKRNAIICKNNLQNLCD